MSIVRCEACDSYCDPTDGDYDEKSLRFYCRECIWDMVDEGTVTEYVWMSGEKYEEC